MSVDDNRGSTVRLQRTTASPLSVIRAFFLYIYTYNPVEEIKIYP